MKLTMTRVLTPLAALAFTLGAQATDFAKDDFEGQWSNSTGGYSFTAGPDQAADATAQYTYDGDAPAAAISPIAGATNTKGLKLSTEDGILFRNLTDADVGASGLYVDTDVQFTITDKSDRPTPVTEGDDTDKFIIWLEVDDTATPVTTNLCVWAREYQVVEGTGIAANSNKVYKLDFPEGVSVAPGEWHRLTVKAIAQTFTMQKPIPGFQVYLDNALLTSGQTIVPDDQYAAFYAEVENSSLTNLIDGDLKFFPAMANTLTSLGKVGFSGEGKIDDFVVSDDIPSSLPRVAVTVNWDDTVISNVTFIANGGAKTLTSSGSLLTLEPGTSATFGMGNINPMPGVDLSSYSFKEISYENWAYSGNVLLALNDGTVTATASANPGVGAFTIALDRNTSAIVTLDWTAIDDRIDSIASVSYSTSGGASGTISGEEAIDQGTYAVAMEIDETITVTVTLNEGVTGVPCLTGTSGVSGSAPTFTVTSNTAGIGITLITPVATVNGQPYATFAEALTAAKAASPATITLNSAITLDAAAVIADGDDITIDLAGQTLTGAADDAVFSNAGTLTITNSVSGGTVIAGANGSAVANTGTLNLQAGKFAGAIAGGTINVSGGSYSANITGATCTPGYELDSVGLDANYPYELSLASYTITYMHGDTELHDITPASYTIEDMVTLTNEVDLGVVGVAFQAWTNAEGTVVAGWPAGGLTGNQVFYAQTTPVVAPTTEYTITYLNSDGSTFTAWATGYTAPASFSNEVVNLPTSANIDFGVVGVQFNNWTNSEGTVVADTTGLEANLTVYANVSALVPPSGTEPGAAVEGSPFASAEAAAAAANSATFKVPDAVAAELTSEQQSAYAILFHAKVGEPVDGQYPVTMELTSEGEATIQSSADVAVAALATNLTAAATAAQQVTVAAQPGFYYSIEAGTEVNNLAEPQQRTLATGDTVTLTMPTLGTKGFYRVKISYEQLEVPQN